MWFREAIGTRWLSLPARIGSVLWIALGLSSGLAQGQWQTLAGGLSNQMRTFCVLPGEEHLLVGGNFPWLNQDTFRVNNIAAWDGTSWSTDHTGGGNGNTWPNGNTNPVLSLLDWNDTLYTGFGDWQWHGDTSIAFGTYLTADGVWHALPTRPDGPVLFAQVNDRLFMGGNANALGGTPFPGLCEILGGQFLPLPNIPFNGSNFWAFDYWQSAYYFGGQLSTIPLGSRNIVAFDGAGTWSPLAQGVGGNHINAIRGFGDSLYVGGFFMPGTNVQSKHIQIWNGVTWHPFFSQVEFIDQVKQIEVYEEALWILGTFQFSSSGPTYAILRYDGHQLCAIGGPEYNTGSGAEMAFFQGYLYKGMGWEYPGLEYEFIGRLPLEGLVPDECIEVVTSVHETIREEDISLYPNPATAHVNITGLNSDNGGIIDVLDVLGKQVLPTERIASPSMTKSVSGLPAGCYQLRVRTPDGTYVKRFAKH